MGRRESHSLSLIDSMVCGGCWFFASFLTNGSLVPVTVHEMGFKPVCVSDIEYMDGSTFLLLGIETIIKFKL